MVKFGDVEYPNDMTMGELAETLQKKTDFEEYAKGFKVQIVRDEPTAEDIVSSLE